MPLKLYLLDDEGKYLEKQVLESDKEETKKQHKPIYHIPDVKYTRVNPPKERDGFDRYFINNRWEYRQLELKEQNDDEEKTEM